MLEQLRDEQASRGLALIGVDVDQRASDHSSPASIEDLRDYGRRFGIAYPLLFDPSRAHTAAYGVSSYPTIVAVGKQGTIAWTGSGEVPLETLRAVAQEIISG